MRIARTIRDLEPCRHGILIPTMGGLHPGHLQMIRRAAELRDLAGDGRPVVVSVFVNPTQFDERHDYDHYPRMLEKDAEGCRKAGADCVFAPDVETIYPPDGSVTVPAQPAVATEPKLEDHYRPGHMAGVCQVCKRLFELARPRQAIFGEKDWQQLQVVSALVRQEQMEVEVVPFPTVREPDGLAMSSRNLHLAPPERRRAVSLFKAMVEAGRHDQPEEAEEAGRRVLLAGQVRPDYVAVRDATTLLAPREGHPARVLVAGRLGSTRLIDNAPWPRFAGDMAPEPDSADGLNS